MRLKSRGLGRKELVMDFREYEAIREGNEVVLVGTIRDPVSWDFSIRICEDDLAGLLRTATKKPVWLLVLRSLFKWKRDNHWSQDLPEHLATGAERRISAKEKARARLEENRRIPDVTSCNGDSPRLES